MRWIIEVTRKCQLKCDHCLRGKAQNKSMSAQDFRKLVKKFDICDVTLTGGEPLLNVDIIEQLPMLNLGMIYIATSGNIPRNTMGEVIGYLAQAKKQYLEVYVDVSDDRYHGRTKKYYEFKEVAEMYGLELGTKSNTRIINMGRASELYLGHENADAYLPKIDEDCDETEFYINVEGDVYVGCDHSYSFQKRFKKELCLGNAFKNTLEELQAKYTKLISKVSDDTTCPKLVYDESGFTITT